MQDTLRPGNCPFCHRNNELHVCLDVPVVQIRTHADAHGKVSTMAVLDELGNVCTDKITPPGRYWCNFCAKYFDRLLWDI